MTVKLLMEQHLKFLSLKGAATCSSESILVKMPHCGKLHVVAQIYSNKKVTSDFHGTVSINPVKMSQQK